MGEREPRKEIINKGELFFLGQPGTETIFSGYGLTVQPDSKAHLVGLLMVDRPKPADPDWLKQVENAFSEYQLVPMTSTGERGRACRMQIEPQSQTHLIETLDPVDAPGGAFEAHLLARAGSRQTKIV
jgi:hypothetical protein